MDLDLAKEKGTCCCCGQPTAASKQTNVLHLDMDPTWEFPRLGNLFDRTINDAMAIICDPCGESIEDGELPVIKYAVEFLGEQLVYHDYISRANGAA